MAKKYIKIPKYVTGGEVKKALGDVGSVYKNFGIGAADAIMGTVGLSNVIQDDAYQGKGAKFGRGYSDVVGGITKAALPMALNAVAPGSGIAVGALQQGLGSVNPEDSSQELDEYGQPIVRNTQKIGNITGQVGAAAAPAIMAAAAENNSGNNRYGGIKYANGGMNIYPGGGTGEGNGQIEKQENSITPNGEFTQYDEPSHEAQNPNVPNASLAKGEMIFSDKLKLGKKTFAELNKPFNTNKEDKMLEKNKSNNVIKLTAQLMKDAKMRQSMQLFQAQEDLKQSKVANYAKRMGVILPSRDNEQMEPQGQSEQSEGEYGSGGIHIDPSKKGTFTAAATKHGKSVQEFASQVLANKENYSPIMVKKANFARNAAKWHHEMGGIHEYADGGIVNPGDPRKVTEIPKEYKPIGKFNGKDVYGTETYIQPARHNTRPTTDPDEYNNFLIGKLQSGVSPDDLIKNKYGTKEAIDKISSYYKQDRVYKDPNTVETTTQPYAGNRSAMRLEPKTTATQPWDTYTVPNLHGQVNKSTTIMVDPTTGNVIDEAKYLQTGDFGKSLSGKTLDEYRASNVRSDAQGQTNNLTNINGVPVTSTGNVQILQNPNKQGTIGSSTSGGFRRGGVFKYINGGEFGTFNAPSDEEVSNDFLRSINQRAPNAGSDEQVSQDFLNTMQVKKMGQYVPTSKDTGSKDYSSLINIGSQVAQGIGQNIGNLYDLKRGNETEVEKYDRLTPNLLNIDATKASNKRVYKNTLDSLKGAVTGNPSAYIQSRMGMDINRMTQDQLAQQAVDNANAGILNTTGAANQGISTAEKIANAQNRAAGRNLKGSAYSNIGQNIMGQSKDYRMEQRDKDFVDLISKRYPEMMNDPEYKKMILKYKK